MFLLSCKKVLVHRTGA